MGKRRNKLPEEAARRHHPAERTPSNSQHQKRVPECVGGWRGKDTMDIPIYIQVMLPLS